MSARTKPRARSVSDIGEAELVAGARRGEEEAIRELIRRLNPRLFRAARGILDSNAEAEEVMQEAYLSAFSNLRNFRGEARFSTWVTRIVLNAARMRRRAGHRHEEEEYDTVTEDDGNQGRILAFPASGIEQPEAALGRKQTRDLLEDAIAELPEEFRLVFLLREAEGMSILAIAGLLGLNPITVKTRLYRTRKRLRALLEARLRGGFQTVFPFGGARCAHMADRVVAALRYLPRS